MKILISLLMLSTAASAQSVSTNSTGLHTVARCTADGEEWFELGPICHSDKAARHGLTTTFSSEFGITNPPAPKCEDGWTLVADSSMHPMCARELRSPK